MVRMECEDNVNAIMHEEDGVRRRGHLNDGIAWPRCEGNANAIAQPEGAAH